MASKAYDYLVKPFYGWNEEVESNGIEFLIHSLRKKRGSESIKHAPAAASEW